MPRLTYESLHWGTPPTRNGDVAALTGPAAPVGEIVAVSYATIKDGKPGVYEHKFSEHAGRRPFLLKKKKGAPRIRNRAALPDDLLAIGRLVDIELEDGRRFIGCLGWVATDDKGQNVWLVAPETVDYGIEPRPGAHHVTDRGIEE